MVMFYDFQHLYLKMAFYCTILHGEKSKSSDLSKQAKSIVPYIFIQMSPWFIERFMVSFISTGESNAKFSKKKHLLLFHGK